MLLYEGKEMTVAKVVKKPRATSALPKRGVGVAAGGKRPGTARRKSVIAEESEDGGLGKGRFLTYNSKLDLYQPVLHLQLLLMSQRPPSPSLWRSMQTKVTHASFFFPR